MTNSLDLDPIRESPADSNDVAWSAAELSVIREGLVSAVSRLTAEINTVEGEISKAIAPSTLDILHDELDLASHRVELLQDSVRADNAQAILDQTVHVLARLDNGLYGRCEGCDQAIARPRLEAFPRATLCMSCVH